MLANGANRSEMGRAMWSWAYTTGHPASDQKLEAAAKAAWPYSLLCAWTYLNDQDAARELAEHAVQNACQYVTRHPDAPSEKLAARPLPALIGTDESQPVIPRQVALPQSPPPLHRMRLECSTVVLPVEHFAANGNVGLNYLSQPRGQPQSNPTHKTGWPRSLAFGDRG